MDDDIYILPNVTEPQPTSSFLSFPPVPVAATLIVSLVWFVYWCIQDYRLFISLGHGGPPHNVYGWILTSFIVRPFTLTARDTTWTGDYPETGAHKEILALPNREGERPIVKGIAPQRQFSQRPTAEMNAKLSSLEKHNIALFVHPSLLSKPHNLPETSVMSKGELGHIHGDTSMHLYFSPADAKVIIEKGWAERHRSARTQPWWFCGKKYMFNIGDSFLIVYAPRDEKEFDVLRTLLRASARFMTADETVLEPPRDDTGLKNEEVRRKSAP
ncbi:hypothetical protein LTR10_017532 [Elasticomyces elasticus]|uniref:Luciferase domain-containing protein n=1 Tax=Exophiala sideris TaxID=1016849 RepID=A0ABR0IZD9_9EURO|nr:hypothetical protein LTR10_017532 [Elasticomyces elasticus]KAK5023463.1 hypothetical protein LTS07_009338 [Exophiala sideris]KAK5028163.1 hypothetical protein LTR13_009151 [Exophiala sideris]KAK5052820.1 hypothetical protein LTR69_009646 [Exophiala sideris]KAK5178432.1 hypothetical protein LTR44_009057 [Eurotiomycetes sp. CCFEE 6388]